VSAEDPEFNVATATLPDFPHPGYFVSHDPSPDAEGRIRVTSDEVSLLLYFLLYIFLLLTFFSFSSVTWLNGSICGRLDLALSG